MKILTFLFILAPIILFSQNVGIGTNTPDANAKLDIQSTTRGVLIPRLTTAERDAIPDPKANGLLIFNSTTNQFEFWNGSAWGPIASASTAVFEDNNGVIRQKSGYNQDFIFGRDALPVNDEIILDQFFFFDKTSGAFRGGRLDQTDNWSPENIAVNSFAYGYEPIASGFCSVAMGLGNKASGYTSLALGTQTDANGESSVSIGSSNSSSADYSVTLGRTCFATSYAETVIGHGNEIANYNGNPTQWVSTDRLFVIGNGIPNSTKSNALVMLKNGNTGIGTSTPDQPLHVKGPMKIEADITDAELRMQSIDGKENRVVLVENNHQDIRIGDIDADNEDLEFWTNGTNRMRIKKDGKIGIGTFSPGASIHIRDDGTSGNPTIVSILESQNSKRPTLLFAENGNNDLSAGMSIEYNGVGTGGSNQLSINRVNGFPAITFRNDGNVGIGTSAPSERLHVVGNICYTGTIGACSDERFKTNFTPINNALLQLTQLNGLYYNWKVEEFPQKDFSKERQIGVIAQEVEALFPEMVMTDKDGYKSVDYSRLTPVLIEAIKELNEELKERDARLDRLEGLVEGLVKNN